MMAPRRAGCHCPDLRDCEWCPCISTARCTAKRIFLVLLMWWCSRSLRSNSLGYVSSDLFSINDRDLWSAVTIGHDPFFYTFHWHRRWEIMGQLWKLKALHEKTPVWEIPAHTQMQAVCVWSKRWARISAGSRRLLDSRRWRRRRNYQSLMSPIGTAIRRRTTVKYRRPSTSTVQLIPVPWVLQFYLHYIVFIVLLAISRLHHCFSCIMSFFMFFNNIAAIPVTIT